MNPVEDIIPIGDGRSLISAIGILDKIETILSERNSATEFIFGFFETIPSPAWVKDLDGKIIFANKLYKNMYPLSSDSELLFPQIIISEFNSNDAWVHKYKRPRIFRESAPTKENPKRISKFLKFPIYSSESVLIGTGGIELFNDTIKEIETSE